MLEYQTLLSQYQHAYMKQYQVLKQRLGQEQAEHQRGYQSTSLETQMASKKEKITTIIKLQKIICESNSEIIKAIFEGGDEIRSNYCENLYELEKCLKKILDLEKPKLDQAGQKRPADYQYQDEIMKRQRLSTGESYSQGYQSRQDPNQRRVQQAKIVDSIKNPLKAQEFEACLKVVLQNTSDE